MGFDCCGVRASGAEFYTVWRNPEFLGCYEPPPLGQGVATGNSFLQGCFSTNKCPTQAVTYSPWTPAGTLALGTNGYSTQVISTVATSAPQAVFGNASHPTYQYIGCYSAGSIGSIFFNGDMGTVPGFTQYQGGNEYGCQEICSVANGGAPTLYAAVSAYR
jgi:hypothetical protein